MTTANDDEEERLRGLGGKEGWVIIQMLTSSKHAKVDPTKCFGILKP